MVCVFLENQRFDRYLPQKQQFKAHFRIFGVKMLYKILRLTPGDNFE
jgi:hypothetical protein